MSIQNYLYEGRRITVDNEEGTTVRLRKNHAFTPNCNILLEPSTNGTTTIAYLESVSKNSVIVKFSSRFSGYLHLQAVSKTFEVT